MNTRNDTTPRDKFFTAVRRSLADDTFVRLRGRPQGTPQFDARIVTVGGGRALQIVTHERTRDLTRNVPAAQAARELETLLAQGCSAWLETTARSIQLIDLPGQRPRLVAHKSAAPKQDAAHDRARTSRLEGAAPLLQALDLVDAAGRPRPGRADKLRQVERYADLLAHAAQQCGWKKDDAVTVADMGCGKAYLTFAAWHLLRSGFGLRAKVIGVDVREELVAEDEELARRMNCDGLSFRTGTIREAALPEVDILIALHACNDATDHAIERGLAAGAKLIVVAPCCHKDVRRALGKPEPIAPLLEHGLFKERFAEWLTDGLRLLRLEEAGYRVTVAEFVDTEHTPKNVLISAVRGNTAERREKARAERAALLTWAGMA
jgi:hypothetical protein